MKLPKAMFRVARPAGFARNYAKTLTQTIVLWVLFLIVVPAGVARLDDALGLSGFPVSRSVAVIGFGLFGSLGLWGGVVMARDGRGTPLPLDTARDLVVTGPYRWVRNPMAIAAPAQAFWVAFWHGSWAVVAYGLAAAVAWNLLIRPSEERELLERFGDPYDRYRRAVRCWILVAVRCRPDGRRRLNADPPLGVAQSRSSRTEAAIPLPSSPKRAWISSGSP